MLKTTTDLLASVNRRAFWPATDGGAPYTHADILALATEELQGPLFTLMVDTASELYTAFTDITILADTTGYRLPAAAGFRLRDITYIDSAGEERQVDAMPKDKLGMLSVLRTGPPEAFYSDGHKIGIYPKPTGNPSGSLRIKYFWQPNTLVAGGTTISALSAGVSVTPAAAVSGWTTSAGATWDVMADYGAHGLIDQFTGTYAATPIITSVAGVDTDNRIGDILAQTGETHVPQLPTEGFKLLCKRVLIECLLGNADKTVIREHQDHANRLEEQFVSYLERPVQGESMIYVNDASPLEQL